MARKISLSDYLNRLSARTPTPGGGSAAALTAALGAALILMAAKYILKKAKSKKAAKHIRAIIKSNEKALRRLQGLMREDERAYLVLVGELKKNNPKGVLKLYKAAAGVPLEVCGIACDAASHCAGLCAYARSPIISDIAEAAILLESAFLSARSNVDINLGSIEDPAYKDKVAKKLRSGEAKVRSAGKNTLRITRKFLKRG